jgi:hypothetical protein
VSAPFSVKSRLTLLEYLTCLLLTCTTPYPRFIFTAFYLNSAFVLYIVLISYVCGYNLQDSEPKYCLHDSNWTANTLLLFALAFMTFNVRYAATPNSLVYFCVSIIFIFVENFYIRLRIVTFWSQMSPANKLHLYVNFLFLVHSLLMAIYYSRSMDLFSESLRKKAYVVFNFMMYWISITETSRLTLWRRNFLLNFSTPCF